MKNSLPELKYLIPLILLLMMNVGCRFTGNPQTNTSSEGNFINTQAASILTLQETPSGMETPVNGFDSAKLGKTETNITYCTMDGKALKMDVYYPIQSSNNTWPVVMYVHGGAWQKGDKNEGVGFREIPALQEEGFLVVSINYRLAPKYPFPAQIQDARCAVRFLRAHASEYNLNPDKVGVWGGSAGGHLVSLLGLAGTSTGWDIGEYLDQSSQVQAVVDMFGPSDLTIQFEGNRSDIWQNVFGASLVTDPKLAAASPVTYITSDAPPFLILHGDKDNLVPLEQSQILFDTLIKAGVSAELLVVQNAGHGFIPVDKKTISPSRMEISQKIVSFFEKNLK